MGLINFAAGARAVVAIVALAATGCGGNGNDRNSETNTEVSSGDSAVSDGTDGTPGAQASNGESEPGVDSMQIDGVWLFTYQPDGDSLDARHGGSVGIQNGCLTVDEAVVVWPASDVELAASYVRDALAGNPTEVVVGGGGFDLDEDDEVGRLAKPIFELCSVRAVWFAEP